MSKYTCDMCCVNKSDWKECPETRAPQTNDDWHQRNSVQAQFKRILDSCLESSEPYMAKSSVCFAAKAFSKDISRHMALFFTEKSEGGIIRKWLGELCYIEECPTHVKLRVKAQMNFPIFE